MSEILNAVLETQPQPEEYLPGEDAIKALRFFAWLDLIGGFIGAFVIWAKSNVFADHGEWNGIGAGVGIAVLLQGMFVCALFLVIASIAENLIEIRRKLTSTSAEILRYKDGLPADGKSPFTVGGYPTKRVLDEGEWGCRCGKVNAVSDKLCPKCGRAPGAIV